ncbi:MAG: alpha/beta hydrolase [Prevotella sp.]|nr:alpha/beta hydrolase [Prevotella sp.]
MKRICRQDLLRLPSVAAFFLFFICSSFAQSTIPIADGGVMYYEETGSGEPVLLLHGHTLDRRMWDGQVEYLKESFRLIVPDMRGYGKTTDPREGYQFTHMDDILTLMDSLHIEKAHVVGLSMGAYVAGDMVALCPERLLSCVMVSGETCRFTSPRIPRNSKEVAERRRNIASVKKDVEGYKRRRVNGLLGACYVGNREKIRPELEKEIMDWGAWQALHVTGRVYYGQDAWAALVKTKPQVPSLIIYGENEKTSKGYSLPYLPNGKLVSVKQCGHMVNLEKPEEFNEMLLQWLENHRSTDVKDMP